MPKITLYGTRFCPFCIRARQLLEDKGVDFEDISVDQDAEQRLIMRERSGRTSVPQIFVDDHHVGGCDELYALERNGELDQLLKQ
ncbi:MAG: glutaredoxin 3 [Gammaproteobacteria bacterium]|nr:glutaredoxin 3 [Gammaproteobacteria bacterium]